MEPFMKYNGNHLFHFTSFESSLRIITSQSLKFGDFSNMNDIAEVKRDIMSMMPTECIEEELRKYKSISLTIDNPDNRGFSIDPLWGHYAQKGNGVCLVFDQNKLTCRLKEQYPTTAIMKPIKYLNEFSNALFSKAESVNDAKDEVHNKVDDIFFTKSADWKYEQELRILLYSEKTYEFLKFGDSLIGVILCLPKVEHYQESSEFQVLKALLPNTPILNYTTALGDKKLYDQNGNPMCGIIGDDLQVDLGNTFHIDLDDNKWSDAKLRWQNVTGEFARCSGFTYKPYHVIIKEAVDGYMRQFSDGNHEMDRLSIPILGNYGRSKTITKWRQYARRSKIIHERLTREGAFGYIDRGNIQYGDEIGFLITQADNKELIIYLTHKGNIIGDLNHPKYGSRRDSNLKRLYQEFRNEFISAGVEECQSKYKTHVSGVAAGFPRFIDNKNAVKPNTWPFIADYKADAENIIFWINGYRDFSSYVWHNHYLRPLGRKGKPFALIPAPNHLHGSDERRAVPIYISEIVENSIEWRVIKAAFKCKNRNERFDIDDFFKNFFNCYDAVTLGRQDGTLELQDDRITISCNNAHLIKVISRDVDSYSGKNISSIIKYDPEEDQVYITNLQCLRAKLSYELLHGYHNNDYNEVAKYDSSLPNSYADFLKQICHIPLLDLQLHNSWISLNKLHFNNDGTVEEIKNILSIEQNDLDNYKWRESVIVHDSATHEAYRIWIENIEHTPWVYRVDFRKEEKPFVELKCINKIKNHLLSIMAFAVIKERQLLYRGKKFDKLQFGYNGTLYEFSVSGIDFDEAYFADGYRGEDEHGETIWDVEYSYANNSILSSGLSIGGLKPITNGINSRRFLDSKFYKIFNIIARHYNGSDKSLKTITKKWFEDFLRQDVEMIDALKNVLHSIKERNNISIEPIKVFQLMRCLKFDNDRSSETYKLINHLERNGFRIILSVEKGQRMLANAESDVSFFLSKDGEIVYGFVDKSTGTIYLDPDLLSIETIVHEYTHLWVQALRHKKPEVWTQLIEDLIIGKNDIWQQVKGVYAKRFKTNNKNININSLIAEEVFAYIVGRRWSEGFPDVSSSRDYNYYGYNHYDEYEKTKRRIRSKYNYEKKNTPEDRVKYLQETVAIDMLSNQPFTNFEILEDWVDEQVKANKLITVNLSHLDNKVFWSIIHIHNHKIEKFDKNNQTITVRSKNMDLLNRWLADDDEDDQDISFHIVLDEDEEAYLPEIFKSTPKEDSNEIDYSKYDQFTLELYDKLQLLEPFAHYVKGGYLTFLGKEGQTLSIKCYNDDGETTIFSIGDPIRRINDSKTYYVAPCDSEEHAVDYLSKAIGYNNDLPDKTNPNAKFLKDFSKTIVLTRELYRDLLLLGRQMHLTKENHYPKEGELKKWTTFYGQNGTTLTLSENSRIGYLIYSKDGINYHTMKCDLDDHLVDDISRDIGYQGHTPVPRIIKANFIDFRNHKVLNKTLYARLLRQGKHMRLTRENKDGKYVMFYGADFNLFVTDKTRIGALIVPMYKEYKVTGYKTLPCDADEHCIDDITKSIGYNGVYPIINPNYRRLKNFREFKILSEDLFFDLLALGPQMRWTRDSQHGKYVIFYGTGRSLFVSPQSHIGSLIVLIKESYYALPCDADEHMADEVTEKIGYVGIKPLINPDPNNLKDFRKYKVLTEELYTDLLSLGAHMRWTREDNKGKYVIFYGIRGTKLYISSRTRIGALITAINDKSYTALPCDADEHMVDVISNAIGFNEVTQKVNPDPKKLKDFSKYNILTKELYADLLALGPGMRLTTLSETEEYVTFYGRITTEQRTRDVEYYYEDGGYYGIEPEEYDVKVRRNLIVSNKTKIGAPICLDGDDYRVLPCDSDEHLVDEVSTSIGYEIMPIEQPDSRLISGVFHNRKAILTAELYSNLLALGPCMRHTDEDENGIFVTFYFIDSIYRDPKKLTVTSNSLIGAPIHNEHGRDRDIYKYHVMPCDADDKLIDDVSKSIGYEGDKPSINTDAPSKSLFYDKYILTKEFYRDLLALGPKRRFTTKIEKGISAVFYSYSESLKIHCQAKIGSPIFSNIYGYYAMPCDSDDERVDYISQCIGYVGDKPAIDRNVFLEDSFHEITVLTNSLYNKLLASGPYMRWCSEDDNGPFVLFYRGKRHPVILKVPYNAKIGSKICLDKARVSPESRLFRVYLALPYDEKTQGNE